MMHFDLKLPSQRQETGAEAPCSEETGLAALVRLVEQAKRTAGASLAWTYASPGPHSGENPVYRQRLERHRRDREALFEAMRRLERGRGGRNGADSSQ